MGKIKAKPEGRKNVWIPEKTSLVEFIKAKKLKTIHNFAGGGNIIIGADHDVESVLQKIEKADRLGMFTDKNMNMGHSLAIITKERLECYDIGEITEKDLEITE